MALDRIPGAANLYIGGIFSLRARDALKKAHITHIVSVFRSPPQQSLTAQFTHLLVEVDDLAEEDIIQQFPISNAFIQEGLDGGGGVLVHCAMGKSRSATVLIAYLLTQNANLDPTSALALIRHTHPMAEPNTGFMSQLDLYHRMQHPVALATHPAYQRWLYQRHVESSRVSGRAPETILFSDESAAPAEDQESLAGPRFEPASHPSAIKPTHPPGTTALISPLNPSTPPSSSLRCRRCRTALATSQYLIPHQPSPPSSCLPSSTLPSPPSPCAHLFLEPLSWMRPELDRGLIAGRLECPNRKCAAQVGKYAWQGMKCSCGAWVVPAVSVARGRVDWVGG